MKQSLRILYISQYFPPEMGAPSARVYELSKRWIEKKQDITVITGFPNHPTGKIPKKYRQHILRTEILDGIKVIRTYIYPTANKGFLKRVISYLTFMFSSIMLGPWKCSQVDFVIATSPQFFVAISGYFISLIKDCPFIFEVRDLWPDSIVQLGQLKNHFIIKMLEYLEFYLYKKSNLIIVVADSSISILRKKGVPESKIKVIKNGVDLNLFFPRKSDKKIKINLGLVDKFIVSYIGTLGLSHALDEVLETAKLLNSYPEIHFLLIGEGAEKENLKNFAVQNSLKNITFKDQVYKNQLPYYYSLSDIVLVTLRNIPIFHCVIPSKIFEIMAMAKPIIITVDGEARKLVTNQAQAGVFLEPGNPESLKNCILNFQRNSSLRQNLGQNGRKFVETYFNRNNLADKYLDILKSIIKYQ